MYTNPYIGSPNPQVSVDRINTQIAELEKMKNQIQTTTLQNATQPSINQTFQLAPTNSGVMKYVNTIDDVNKEVVFGDTPFFSKDLSVMWLKNSKGEVKSYELNEIVQKDEKDLKIDFLMAQIEELKRGMISNESNANISKPVTDAVEIKEPTTIPTVRATKTKSK